MTVPSGSQFHRTFRPMWWMVGATFLIAGLWIGQRTNGSRDSDWILSILFAVWFSAFGTEPRAPLYELVDTRCDFDRALAQIWIDGGFGVEGVLWIEGGRLCFESTTHCFRWEPDNVRLIRSPGVDSSLWTFEAVGSRDFHQVIVQQHDFRPAGQNLVKPAATKYSDAVRTRPVEGELDLHLWTDARNFSKRA